MSLLDKNFEQQALDPMNGKSIGILNNLLKQFRTLMAGRFTGQIIINMSQGGITKVYKHEEVNLKKN